VATRDVLRSPNHRFGSRQQLAIARHDDKRPILLGVAHLSSGIEGPTSTPRVPIAATWSGDRRHVTFMPPTVMRLRAIPSEHFQPWRFLRARNASPAVGRNVSEVRFPSMPFEKCQLAAPVDANDGTWHVVRIGMHVDCRRFHAVRERLVRGVAERCGRRRWAWATTIAGGDIAVARCSARRSTKEEVMVPRDILSPARFCHESGRRVGFGRTVRPPACPCTLRGRRPTYDRRSDLGRAKVVKCRVAAFSRGLAA